MMKFPTEWKVIRFHGSSHHQQATYWWSWLTHVPVPMLVFLELGLLQTMGKDDMIFIINRPQKKCHFGRNKNPMELGAPETTQDKP